MISLTESELQSRALSFSFSFFHFLFFFLNFLFIFSHFSFSFIFLHFLSFSFIFFHFLSFPFIFFHFSIFIVSFFHFLSISFIFFHFLSFSFIFFLSGAQNLIFSGLNFVAISLNLSFEKNQFFGQSRGVPFWGFFSFFPPFSFPPFSFFFFFFYIFSFFFFSMGIWQGWQGGRVGIDRFCVNGSRIPKKAEQKSEWGNYLSVHREARASNASWTLNLNPKH